MRGAFLVIILCFSSLVGTAQINNDGKSEINDLKSNKRNYNIFSNSILGIISLSEEEAIIGLKYQYCSSFGGYLSLETNGNEPITNITLGLAKSITEKSNIYLGYGFRTSNESYSSDLKNKIELGLIIKFKRLALDFGGGYGYFEYGYYVPGYYESSRGPLLNIGLGINF